jgi:hypothetical protein
MNKKRELKITAISCAIAVILAVVAASVIPVIRANAATVKKTSYALPATTSKTNEFAKAYSYKAAAKIRTGSDWSFKADAKNIKVKHSVDKASGKHVFKFSGTSYGLSKVTLKYKVSAKKFTTVKMKLFVDPQKYIMRTA